MNKFAIAAALAASLLAATPAAAESFVVRIDYADLDLASAAGTRALGQRIAADAESACGRPDIRNLKGMAAFARCKDQVVSGAVEQLVARDVSLNPVN